jgi:hypothetical protein
VFEVSCDYSGRIDISRLQRLEDSLWSLLGRWPRLSHFAPLALKSKRLQIATELGGSFQIEPSGVEFPLHQYQETWLGEVGDNETRLNHTWQTA